MAKRELGGGTFEKVPVVRLTEVAGSTFIGKLIGNRDTKFGKSFEFNIQDGSAPIKVKDDAKNWVDVAVKPGDKVAVLSSKDGQLERKLLQAIAGERVEIVFHGKQVNPKTGRAYNNFTVSIIE